MTRYILNLNHPSCSINCPSRFYQVPTSIHPCYFAEDNASPLSFVSQYPRIPMDSRFFKTSNVLDVPLAQAAGHSPMPILHYPVLIFALDFSLYLMHWNILFMPSFWLCELQYILTRSGRGAAFCWQCQLYVLKGHINLTINLRNVTLRNS